MLSKLNFHPRDSKIIKLPKGYQIESFDKPSIRVTTLVHKWFNEFNSDLVIDNMMNSKKWKDSKYFGRSKDDIKMEWSKNGEEAAKLGTLLHEDIERFFNDEKVLNEDTVEFGYFVNFWEEFKLKNPQFNVYRTEWTVYDEDKNVAGTIDCVLADENDNMVILDWKRSKEIKTQNFFEKGFGPFSDMDNCNYNHYRIQLNIYRSILERKYDKNVVGMFIVVLNPINSGFLMYEMKRKSLNKMWDLI